MFFSGRIHEEILQYAWNRLLQNTDKKVGGGDSGKRRPFIMKGVPSSIGFVNHFRFPPLRNITKTVLHPKYCKIEQGYQLALPIQLGRDVIILNGSQREKSQKWSWSLDQKYQKYQ